MSPFNNRSIPAFFFCRDTSSPSSDRLKDAAEALPAPWGSVSCRHVLRSYFMCLFPPPLPVFLMLGTQHLHWIGFSSSPFVMRFSLFFLSYFSRRACFLFFFPLADCHFAVYGLFLIQLLFWLRASQLSSALPISLPPSLCDSLACLVSRGDFAVKAWLCSLAPLQTQAFLTSRLALFRAETSFSPVVAPFALVGARLEGASCSPASFNSLVFYRQ